MITAAHCAYQVDLDYFIGKENIKVLVGATNLLDSNESTKQSVQRIIRVHPQYLSHSFSNDVAVLQKPCELDKTPKH